MWDTVRAATVRKGDVTPAGAVDRVHYFGEIRRVVLDVGTRQFSRHFDDLVDVAVLEGPEAEP